MPQRPTQGKQLISALPSDEWQRWLPRLEWVDMPLGAVLYESGDTMGHVYFPTTAIVSLLHVLEDGGSAEIAVVGNEGVVGIPLFHGQRAGLICYARGRITVLDRPGVELRSCEC